MIDRVLFTVGSVLRGDDAAGPLLAKLMEESPACDRWEIVDGAQTPEDDLGYIRKLAPRTVVLVDAAAMGLEPGEIRRLTRDDVSSSFLMSTHALPMTLLLGELEDMAERVVFLGIQPKDTTFFESLTPEVRAAVCELRDALVADDEGWSAYPFLR